MKTLFSVAVTALAMLTMNYALAGDITDVGATAYWGANDHTYKDVIGSSTYDISGATITRIGNILTIKIATNFAGNAGDAPTAAPGGIAYGDVFLAKTWNPAGSAASDPHHLTDNAANGTLWSYGFSLNDRWSNTGGTFQLYQLGGTTNAASIKNSESFMTCAMGTECYYRNGQATAVNKAAGTKAVNTGMSGTWSVVKDKSLTFSIDLTQSSDLLSYSSFAMHWGETCANDVIEGMTNLPLPGSLPLLGIGLAAMLLMRRRRPVAIAAA